MFDRLNPDRQIDTYHRLADGSLCRIRPSGAADRALLLECFEALSPESRRMRFFTNKRSLTPAELDLFSGADGYDHIAIAAVRIDTSGRELEPLGFARCMRLVPGGESAELSITVADRFHGQGIGSALLTRLMDTAYAQGIRRFRFEVMIENRGMRQLAQGLGGEAHWLGDGIVEYDCALPEPAVAEPAADRPGAVAGRYRQGSALVSGPGCLDRSLDPCVASQPGRLPLVGPGSKRGPGALAGRGMSLDLEGLAGRRLKGVPKTTPPAHPYGYAGGDLDPSWISRP